MWQRLVGGRNLGAGSGEKTREKFTSCRAVITKTSGKFQGFVRNQEKPSTTKISRRQEGRGVDNKPFPGGAHLPQRTAQLPEGPVFLSFKLAEGRGPPKGLVDNKKSSRSAVSNHGPQTKEKRNEQKGKHDFLIQGRRLGPSHHSNQTDKPLQKKKRGTSPA